MGKPIEITTETWSDCMAKVLRLDGSIANLLQRMMMFAFAQYEEGKNSNWLSEVVGQKYKSVRSAALQEYVEAHTDLVLTKMDNGDYRFKREAVEGKPSYKKPELTWYEFSSKGKPSIVKPDAVLKRTIKSLEDAMDEKKEKKSLEDGTEEYAKTLIAYLKAAPAANAVAA